jgi:hypothetical protein
MITSAASAGFGKSSNLSITAYMVPPVGGR